MLQKLKKKNPKLDNLEQMDKFLEHTTCQNQIKKKRNMNGLITNVDINSVIEAPPKIKSLGPDGFSSEFYY